MLNAYFKKRNQRQICKMSVIVDDLIMECGMKAGRFNFDLLFIFFFLIIEIKRESD